jgi:hypothetical protein
MNLQEWVEKYRPIITKRGEPYAFETYGGSISFVNKNDPHHIWTLCESDGVEYLSAGKRLVNRLNYFVCEVAWTEEDERYVVLTDEDNIDIYFGL